jgi:NADH-quinone oxidoreductase subunit M
VALTLTLVVPAVVAVWLLAAGRGYAPSTARGLALLASVVTFLLTVLTVLLRSDVDAPWVSSLGLRWHFAIDGVSVPLALLTAGLGVAVVVHARGREPGRAGLARAATNTVATYYACLLLVEFGALATFFARDAILFFVAFEVVLVPMWVLISRFGDEHATERARADASNRFVLFTALGSTLMLLGILVLVVQSGTSDLGRLAAAHGAGLSTSTQVLVAVLLVVGLGIKVPLWPLHTWLPPAHTIAPTAGSVLLAAVLLKMGTYGIVRLAVPTVPEGFSAVAPYLAASGAVGILWGGLACMVERDLKRLVAYSSVAHMGFVALGLASGTATGMQAALFANVAHGLVSALLFFVVGGLKERWGSADLAVARRRAA